MKPTTMVRLWSLQNVFLLWLTRPKILELSADRCVVRIPLNWITRRRDIKAMYLGTLCMGADVAAGLIAFTLVAQKKVRVNFIFKDIKGEFLKRAEGDVLFTNNDGPLIQDLVKRALLVEFQLLRHGGQAGQRIGCARQRLSGLRIASKTVERRHVVVSRCHHETVDPIPNRVVSARR